MHIGIASMRQFQCVPTTYVHKIKETYFEIYTEQVLCPLALPLFNISKLPISIEIPVTIPLYLSHMRNVLFQLSIGARGLFLVWHSSSSIFYVCWPKGPGKTTKTCRLVWAWSQCYKKFLTFISMIITTIFIFQHFSFYEQMKFPRCSSIQ